MPIRGRRRRSTAAQPRTVMGLWLRAVLADDDDDELQRLTSQLNRGDKGWNRDEAGVVQAACDLAVREYFGTDYDVRQVSEVVSFIREARIARDHLPHGQLEMEAVIRHALLETDVDVSGISSQAAFEIQIGVIAYVVRTLAWQEPRTIALIIEAERIAFGRGLNPPLAA